jgi:hypothetical protein
VSQFDGGFVVSHPNASISPSSYLPDRRIAESFRPLRSAIGFDDIATDCRRCVIPRAPGVRFSLVAEAAGKPRLPSR